VTLHVWGVPTGQIPAAMTRGARDRLTLRGYPGLTFAKVLGTGSGLTFAPRDADPHHWALLACWDAPQAAEAFERSRVVGRWDAAATERLRLTMTPLTSTGRWSGRDPFGSLGSQASELAASSPGAGEPIAALTRARIQWRQLPAFWKTLPAVVAPLPTQPGLVWSLGMGEAPVGFQGTFTVWHDLDAMLDFAYNTPGHREAIRATRERGWFTEELFARLRVRDIEGTFDGKAVTIA
jgi:hypothetical protein